MNLSLFKHASNGISNLKSITYSPYGEPKSKIHPKGFTLVEMLIVAPIVILVIGVFVSAIVNMTGEVLSSRGANALTYSVQNALNTIDADVKTSGGYLAKNNIPLSNGQGYDNGTLEFHNANDTSIGAMLILNSYATTAGPLSSTRSNIYITGQPNTCISTLVSQNTKLIMNIVYFVKNDSLWRRVIMPSTYESAGCNVPWQKPTCVPGYDSAIYTFCKANDTKLVEGISASGFDVDYYAAGSTSANTTANDSNQTDAARQTTMRTTNTVSVTINATKTIAGRDIIQSGTIKSVSANNDITIPPAIDSNWIPGIIGTVLEGKYVHKTDLTGSYQYKTTNTAVEYPQGAIGLDPVHPSNMVLVSPQTFPSIIFSDYPAQNACKAINGRLPILNELHAMYEGLATYGNFQYGSSVRYWSSTEVFYNYAYEQEFSDSGETFTFYSGKTNMNYVRCVKD